MSVVAITKYSYEGKEYNSLLELKEDLHNTIGLEVLDQITRTCPLQKHKDYEKLLDLLCSPTIRSVLLRTLNVNFEKYDEYTEEFETVNILDIK